MNLIEKIRHNKENRSSQNYNCIPFSHMSRLENFIPGIMKSSYWLVTANSGVGKSKLARSMFIHHPVQWAWRNKKKLKILFFSFEEGREKVIVAETARLLYKKHKIAKTNRQIMSVGRYNTIDEDTIQKIEGLQGHMNVFKKYVTVYDNVNDPDKIFSIVQSYLHRNGRVTMTTEERLVNGVWQEEHVPDSYIPDDPEEYVIVMLDHIGLLNKTGMDTKGVIEYWSSNLSLKLRDTYGCVVVNVQQQASSKESLNNFNAGKLEPNTEGLAESKLTQRDANIVLGLYNPDKHGILDYKGINVSIMKDNFRALIILKDRNGVSNVRLPLYFDGRIDYFHELPKNKDHMKQVYDTLTDNNSPPDDRQDNLKAYLTEIGKYRG